MLMGDAKMDLRQRKFWHTELEFSVFIGRIRWNREDILDAKLFITFNIEDHFTRTPSLSVIAEIYSTNMRGLFCVGQMKDKILWYTDEQDRLIPKDVLLDMIKMWDEYHLKAVTPEIRAKLSEWNTLYGKDTPHEFRCRPKRSRAPRG
jgi:hypothetical protein